MINLNSFDRENFEKIQRQNKENLKQLEDFLKALIKLKIGLRNKEKVQSQSKLLSTSLSSRDNINLKQVFKTSCVYPHTISLDLSHTRIEFREVDDFIRVSLRDSTCSLFGCSSFFLIFPKKWLSNYQEALQEYQKYSDTLHNTLVAVEEEKRLKKT